eukprot:GHVS01083937.1.p1 GENE.GHVS01083937.1~~GHVS01083937.1.p1  ORF type:complete len:585 (-),score=135.11 GHVS01083937.1:121-1875(-)
MKCLRQQERRKWWKTENEITKWNRQNAFSTSTKPPSIYHTNTTATSTTTTTATTSTTTTAATSSSSGTSVAASGNIRAGNQTSSGVVLGTLSGENKAVAKYLKIMNIYVKATSFPSKPFGVDTDSIPCSSLSVGCVFPPLWLLEFSLTFLPSHLPFFSPRHLVQIFHCLIISQKYVAPPPPKCPTSCSSSGASVPSCDSTGGAMSVVAHKIVKHITPHIRTLPTSSVRLLLHSLCHYRYPVSTPLFLLLVTFLNSATPPLAAAQAALDLTTLTWGTVDDGGVVGVAADGGGGTHVGDGGVVGVAAEGGDPISVVASRNQMGREKVAAAGRRTLGRLLHMTNKSQEDISEEKSREDMRDQLVRLLQEVVMVLQSKCCPWWCQDESRGKQETTTDRKEIGEEGGGGGSGVVADAVRTEEVTWSGSSLYQIQSSSLLLDCLWFLSVQLQMWLKACVLDGTPHTCHNEHSIKLTGEVCEVLDSLQYGYTINTVSGCVVIPVVLNNTNIVLECAGTGDISSCGDELVPSMQRRHEYLRSLGWVVRLIHHEHWPSTSSARASYLRGLVRTAFDEALPRRRRASWRSAARS